MTKQFRVYVRNPDGRYGVEQRRVVNFPQDINPGADTERYLRDLWAKHYPGETYDEIEQMDGTNLPRPLPGQFPAGVQL